MPKIIKIAPKILCWCSFPGGSLLLYTFFGQLSRSRASPPHSAFLDGWENSGWMGKFPGRWRQPNQRTQGAALTRCLRCHLGWQQSQRGWIWVFTVSQSPHLKPRVFLTSPLRTRLLLHVMGVFCNDFLLLCKLIGKMNWSSCDSSLERHNHLMDRDIVNMSLTTGQKVPVITPQALRFWIFWKNRNAGHWRSLRQGWSSSQVGGSASPGLFAVPSASSWLHFCPWTPRAKEFSRLARCSTASHSCRASSTAHALPNSIEGADKRFHISQGFTACNYYISQSKNYLAQERSEIPLGYSPREKSFPVHSGPDSALDSHCFTGKINTHLRAFLRQTTQSSDELGLPIWPVFFSTMWTGQTVTLILLHAHITSHAAERLQAPAVSTAPHSACGETYWAC